METAIFNLKKALAGHPLVTRSGKPVTGFRFRDDDPGEGQPFEARIDAHHVSFFTPEGHRYSGAFMSEGDLFLLLEDEPKPEPGPKPEPKPEPTLSIPEPIARHLADLTDTGLYGTTVEDTALLLLKERLRDIVNPSQHEPRRPI